MSGRSCFTMVAVVGAIALCSTPALALIQGWNPQPDRVLGQPTLSDYPECNRGGISASSLCGPYGVAVDAAGNVYVADRGNNRVLEYDAPWAPGGDTVADRVFGQPDFTTNTPFSYPPSCNSATASNFCWVTDVAVDSAGNLYVVDYLNSRVLEFDNPLAPGGDNVADRVLGQQTLTTTGCNNGGVSANSLCRPHSIAVDSAGNVYVGDQGNGRVLEYDNPVLTDDVTADRVFGSGRYYIAEVAVDPAATRLVVISSGWTGTTDAYDNPLTTDSIMDHSMITYQACSVGGVDASMNLFCMTPYNGVSGYLSPFSTDKDVDIFIGVLPPYIGFSAVNGISVDSTGSLYVSDASRVVIFSPPLFPPDTDGDGVYDFRDPCPLETPRLGLDLDEDGCTDTIAGLRNIVISEVSSQPYQGNFWNGLIGKLDDAQKALDRGNTRAAVNKLTDFITQYLNWIKGCDDSCPIVIYANNVIAVISS